MSDCIEVRGLRVLGTHGALPGEQDQVQPFELDLVVETDLAGPAGADEVVAAVDYGSLVEEARRIVATERFQLLETLAEAVAQAVLGDARVISVTVGVRKLRPPLPADVSSVGVRLTRRQDTTRQGAEQQS